MLKISVVTISYNQAEFLERCIQSVLNQNYANLEYIMVDAGSTDGSRDIIEQYKSHFSQIVLEPDDGPADGLNKGFAKATGDILYFINSDDMICPGSFHLAEPYFSNDQSLDVLYGNGYKIDENDRIFKRVIANNYFSPKHYAYNSFAFIQQSTFFTKSSFDKIGGFNHDNKIAWDGELMVDFGLAGCNIKHVNTFLSMFRWYDESISGSGRFAKLHEEYNMRIFRKIMGRDWRRSDKVLKMLHLIFKHVKQPSKILNFIPCKNCKHTL